LKAAYGRKADEILVLDLRKLAPSLCDFFVLMTGVTKDHLRALSDQIEETLDEAGVLPLHMEGYDVGKWILIDYGDFVFHIMDEEARTYYGLEMLWGDAPKRAFPDDFQRAKKAD
jgi:ribosome-associated protein